jgi:glycosyltransferase involved in cell wall biosynthesis
MIRTLTYSTLFPNAEEPIHGVFVETRLRHLLLTGEVSTTVVAPVPWFPSGHSIFGNYAKYARVAENENRLGLRVYHPRYPLIPKFGTSTAPALLAAATLPFVRRLKRQGVDFDLIDAHYFYPDGVAAVILGRILQKPVVITGRGTDLNLIPEMAIPRAQIRWAAKHAAGLVTVCQALRERLVQLGVAADRVHVLRNGVDLDLFHPIDRAKARASLGIQGVALASVGGLVELKGHHHVIGALPQLPNITLFIAGKGPERARLENLASELGVSQKVRFLGALSQSELRALYEAVDVTVLASSREGWANVLLESMACGTPVLASSIGGTPEVVAAPEAGRLVQDLSADAFAHAIAELIAHLPDRNATLAYARQFTWDSTSEGQIALFRGILTAH